MYVEMAKLFFHTLRERIVIATVYQLEPGRGFSSHRI